VQGGSSGRVDGPAPRRGARRRALLEQCELGRRGGGVALDDGRRGEYR